MKAVRAHAWCEPSGLRMDEVPDPTPGPGEIGIRIRSASVNFPDILIIRGKYQVQPDLPFVPGFEVAGEVDAVGDGVEGFAVGQRVLAQLAQGGYADGA